VKTALADLAVRCEQATGPDLALDLVIAANCHPDGKTMVGWDYEEWTRHIAKHPFDTWVPRYTASLDAAMTLVPEGCIWEVGHKVNYPAPPTEPNRAHYAFVNVGKPGAIKSFNGKAFATPALALCAAALRARGEG
jgi:hypothetical protein